MSDRAVHGNDESAPKSRLAYKTPVLARYGSLFVETGTMTCSAHVTDCTVDPCDPDNGSHGNNYDGV